MSSTKSRFLLRGGQIISMDPGLGDLRGDVLIEDDRIVAVDRDLGAADEGAEVIDASGHLVIPGFVDSHRHLYQAIVRGLASDWTLFQYFFGMFGALGPHFESGDMYWANALGAFDALDSGVTTVFDWSHNQATPEHTDELVRALKESGIRAVFGYGGTMQEQAELLRPPFKGKTPTNAAEVRRVRSEHCPSDDGLVTLGLAARGPETSTMEVVREDWALAEELAIPINIHIGMAILDLEGRPSVKRLHDEGLLRDDLIFGHCNRLTPEEMSMMASAGVKASVTPEDECMMGHGWPPIAALLKAGIRPNIGADTCMAVGGDPFTAMRFALAITRGLANDAILEAGENPWKVDVTARDVLEFATIDGARTLGMDDRIGSVSVGKQADLVLIDTADISVAPVLEPTMAIVHHATRRAVDHVFVAGQPVKRDGALTADLARTCVQRAPAVSAQIIERASFEPGWSPQPPH